MGWGAGGAWQAPSTGSTLGCEKILREAGPERCRLPWPIPTTSPSRSSLGPAPQPVARPPAPPELGVLLVEVATLPSRPVPDLQHLDDDVVALPAPPPQLPRHGRGQWGGSRGTGPSALPTRPPCRQEEGMRRLRGEPETAGVTVAEPRPVPQPGAGKPPGHGALAPAMPTSPDWFSLSLCPRFSCLKSMPASLFRVPFPASTGRGGGGLGDATQLPPSSVGLPVGDPKKPPPSEVPPNCPRGGGKLTWPGAGRALPEGVLVSVSGRAAVLRARMQARLEAARFRYLNQQLQAGTSRQAARLLQHDPEAFALYHRGFARQAARWPEQPAQRVVRYLRRRPASLVVADLGCGDCQVARGVRNTVHSFDLVALQPGVTVCDMAEVPLGDASVDVAVFCLSLMGTNLREILEEANRLLRPGGTLLVAEVASRFPDVRTFVGAVTQLGFKIVSKDLANNFFYFFEFSKTGRPHAGATLPGLQLRPCLYKKR
uniref:Ribosomal RNA-processing protein 8 n=1 Tax=Crocodylus porosus TaxID=8502 RepID=A0A7M4G1Z1_CROPO